MAIDLLVKNNEDIGLYDISLKNGDFETVDSFDSSIKVSLFADKRADKSEVATPHFRRGWWADQFSKDLGFKIGSKLWLLDQARRTQNNLNRAENYARKSLQWLIDDNYATNVSVIATYTDIGIQLAITLFRGQSKTETKYFDLWENGGDLQ